MSIIGVVSHCKETAQHLETVLSGSGHVIEWIPGIAANASLRSRRSSSAEMVDLCVVDVDCATESSLAQIGAITSDPETAFKPVLVAA